jgi:hypothetical protein
MGGVGLIDVHIGPLKNALCVKVCSALTDFLLTHMSPMNVM